MGFLISRPRAATEDEFTVCVVLINFIWLSRDAVLINFKVSEKCWWKHNN